jgi:hypothetical protein
VSVNENAIGTQGLEHKTRLLQPGPQNPLTLKANTPATAEPLSRDSSQRDTFLANAGPWSFNSAWRRSVTWP